MWWDGKKRRGVWSRRNGMVVVALSELGTSYQSAAALSKICFFWLVRMFSWGDRVYEPWDPLSFYIYCQIWHSVLHIQLYWHVLESVHATMPKDCCPRIVITQNRLNLAFSVNATFKLKIEFSIFSRNYTLA